MAGFRSGIAAVMFLLVMPRSRRLWDARAALVGASYAITMILFVLANRLTTSANTIFLQSAAPLYVLLFAPKLLGERNRPSDLLVMLLVGTGLSLVFFGTETPVRTAPDPVRGNLLAALSGACWAFTVMGMRWLGREQAAGRSRTEPAVAIGNLLALLISLPFALPVTHARPTDWAIVVGLGTVQIGLAYVFLTKAILMVPALEAMVLLLLEPVFNPVWAWLWHGERPGLWSIVGGALILGATVLKTWQDSRATGAGGSAGLPGPSPA